MTTATSHEPREGEKQAAGIGSRAHDNINNSGNNHTHCVTAQKIALHMINAAATLAKIFTRNDYRDSAADFMCLAQHCTIHFRTCL